MNHNPNASSPWRSGPQTPWMITLPGARFIMGESREDKFANHTERPAHPVDVAPFALGRFPVTVAEFRTFCPEYAAHDETDLPVVNVNWHDARAYCDWLSEITRRHYRLPSEAEWEYACRAGSEGPFAFGPEIHSSQANFLYSESGERIGLGRRTPRGAYPANAFGLHDLHGNVCEWMEDMWHPNYVGAPADGFPWQAAPSPTLRVIRGGAWDYLPRLLRSAWRDGLEETKRRDNVGFRVAMSDFPA